MRHFQTLLFILFCGTVFGQLEGSWQGILIQKNADESTTNFAIWVELKVEDTQLIGKLRSEQANSPFFKVSGITGTIDGDEVSFKEEEIVNHNTQQGQGWCLLLAKFVYHEAEQKLKGTYSSATEGCIPGALVLVKSNKAFNHSATTIVEASSLEEVESLLNTKQNVVGKQFVLSDVNYQSGRHSIVSSSYPYLNKIALLLSENNTIRIHLKGHTDSDGDDENNFMLSQKRAKSVSNYLVKKEIKQERITFEGYGESRSIATNETKEGKKENRRVELLIISE
jgi:outer membrane protein OmpA-like peptidoglycan-associated protein